MSALENAVSAPMRQPLVVTRRPLLRREWADVAQSAGAGLKLWRERRHSTVFADFGDLGFGVSGARLAKIIRSESKTARIYLFSDQPHVSQRFWAQANGANGVITRSPEAIADCLSGMVPPDEPIPVPARSQADPVETLAANAMASIKAQGPVSPMTYALTLDVIEEFVGLNNGSLPSVREVATMVRMAAANG